MSTNPFKKAVAEKAPPWTAAQYYRRAVETGQMDKAKLWRAVAVRMGEIGPDEFFVPPRPHNRTYAEPLSRDELDNMDPGVRSLGLKYGHLEYDNGLLVEARKRGEIIDPSEPR